MDDDLVSNLRDAYAFNRDPLHQRAANHIEELNRALEGYATETIERIDELEAALLRVVEWAESHGLYADEEAQLHPVFTEARVALEGKDEP